MKTVYLSSTYEDLKDERAAADQAIRSLGHQSCAMEGYAASDGRPLAKCLEDVRKCDIYLGIFALRYGYVPPEGDGKSITHLELEEARRHGKPVLAFLLREDAPWYPNRIDKDRARIDALRAQLCQDLCIRWFAGEHQLAAEVTRALSVIEREVAPAASARLAPTPGRDVPPLLPYMPDRVRQEHQLNEALMRLDRADRRRPLVCVLHGDEQQCHDEFVLRLRDGTLAGFLDLESHEASVRVIPLTLPRRPVGSIGEAIRGALATRMLKRGGASIEDVARAIALHRGPVVIEVHPVVEEWLQGEARAFAEFLDTWARWPDLAADQWLIICVCVKYRSATRGILDRIRLRKVKGRARGLIGPPIRVERPEGVELVVLEELDDVRKSDVLDWVRELGDDDFGGRLQLQPDIEELFGRPEYRRSGAIAMRTLADELMRILKRRRGG